MATPPDSPIEEVVYELEPTRAPKPVPVALEDLCRLTKFTRQEIRVMYRGFKTECPDGVVNEDSFKDIYAKFFPHGNSSLYAHYVFKAFDVNCNGSITFRDVQKQFLEEILKKFLGYFLEAMMQMITSLVLITTHQLYIYRVRLNCALISDDQQQRGGKTNMM
ncbi:hypothetical protein RP20_CCG013048 [Aedes albopictus]|nr:hypothetical protein RP20_CCG013048 [Aedes albopictus]